MYAFRGPSTAGTYDDGRRFGPGPKTTLVVARAGGYLLSEFVGVRVVSGTPAARRAAAIVGLAAAAGLALVAFAAPAASFTVSPGVAKSVGRWSSDDRGVGEFAMPAVAGAPSFPPLLISARAPAEDAAADRPGPAPLTLVHGALTVFRTLRDDSAVEIWRDLGAGEVPPVYAQSETVVAVAVTAPCGATY